MPCAETHVRFSRRSSNSSFRNLISSTTSSSDHFLVENDFTRGRSFWTSIEFRLALGARLSRFCDFVIQQAATFEIARAYTQSCHDDPRHFFFCGSPGHVDKDRYQIESPVDDRAFVRTVV